MKWFIILGLIIVCSASLFYAIPEESFAEFIIEANIFPFHYSDGDIHRRALFEDLEKTAQEVAAAHEYELHVFDCTDFSEELGEKLREKGYDAYCVFGFLETSDYRNHTWIEVNISGDLLEIESTQGFIIDEDYFNENYIVLSKGECL
jgi:hypothetical protein